MTSSTSPTSPFPAPLHSFSPPPSSPFPPPSPSSPPLPPHPPLSRAELLDALEKMLRIRQFEQRAEAAYQQGKIGGFFHSYMGQEAIQIAAFQHSVWTIGILPPTDVMLWLCYSGSLL